jgi:hypothetical protein
MKKQKHNKPTTLWNSFNNLAETIFEEFEMKCNVRNSIDVATYCYYKLKNEIVTACIGTKWENYSDSERIENYAGTLRMARSKSSKFGGPDVRAYSLATLEIN